MRWYFSIKKLFFSKVFANTFVFRFLYTFLASYKQIPYTYSSTFLKII